MASDKDISGVEVGGEVFRRIRFIHRYGWKKYRQMCDVGPNPHHPESISIWDVRPGMEIECMYDPRYGSDLQTVLSLPYEENGSWWADGTGCSILPEGKFSLADNGIVPYGVGRGNHWNPTNWTRPAATNTSKEQS